MREERCLQPALIGLDRRTIDPNPLSHPRCHELGAGDGKKKASHGHEAVESPDVARCLNLATQDRFEVPFEPSLPGSTFQRQGLRVATGTDQLQILVTLGRRTTMSNQTVDPLSHRPIDEPIR